MPIAPADPALSALRELLPASGAPHVVSDTVAEMLGADIQAHHAKLTYVRYRPAKDCVFLWSFPTQSGKTVLISGKLYNDDRGAGIVERGSFKRLMESVHSSANEFASLCQYLPEYRLLLQAFPLDQRLPGLHVAVPASRMREVFACPPQFPQDDGCKIDISPLSYKPWLRCVLQYTFEGREQHFRRLVKVYRDDPGNRFVACQQALSLSLRASGAPWDVAAPLSYFPEAHMLVMEEVGDRVDVNMLLKEAADNPRLRETLRGHIVRMAEGLFPFQQIELDGLPSVSPQDLLIQITERKNRIREVAPAFAKAIEDVISELEGEIDLLSPEPMVLAHGAFRHEHFIPDGDKMTAIDLDNLCFAGSSFDAGYFLAYLDLTSLKDRQSQPLLIEWEEAFIDTIRLRSTEAAAWLAWYRAATHIKWALRNFFSLAPGWPETTESLIQTARRALAKAPTAACSR